MTSLDRIIAAVQASLISVTGRSKPDAKDIKADAVLTQEAANADLTNSRAEGTRIDTRLRILIVYILGGSVALLVVLLIVFITLQMEGFLKDMSLVAVFSAAGGIITILVGGLVWMLKRA